MEYLSKKTYKLEKIFSHIFFFLFIMQILSPSIYGKTFYLEIFIALLNPFFLNWLKRKRIQPKHMLCTFGFLFISILGNFLTAAKILMIIIGVIYLYYSEERKVFYIRKYVAISICFAIVQFVFLFIDPGFAMQLGPENISTMLWGEYATATNTNFYTIFLLPRVSGLSREAGFFASLIVAVIFFYYLRGKYEKFELTFIEKIFLVIGYVLSFSKMSLVIFILFLFEKMKKILDYIPVIYIATSFVLLMMLIWNLNVEYLMQVENITFLHRFSAYVCLYELDWEQLFFGVKNTTNIDGYIAKLVNFYFEEFAGFGGFLLSNGILSVLMYLYVLYIFGVSGTGLLVLLLLTINVQLDTNQNFSVLAYFIVFRYFNNKTSKYKIV